MPTKMKRRNLVIVGGAGLGAILVALSLLSYVEKNAMYSPAPESAKPASTSWVENVVRDLDWGNIVFNAPTTMKYQRPTVVELLLSPSLSVLELQARLQEKAGAEAARVRISNRMEAQLTGQGFAIETLVPGLQAVGSTEPTRWKWLATPTEHGKQILYLTLSAYVDVSAHDTPFVVRTFERAVEVEITVPQRVAGFAQNNWQWLWAAVLVPIAGYLWKRWKKQPDGQDTT